MRFEDFVVGQTFTASIIIAKSDFDIYISFARTRNKFHENPELAEKEGIRGLILPGRSIIARAEGEMTGLAAFSDCVMLLYGMDGDPVWGNRHTRFLSEVYAGDELLVKYIVSDKKDDEGYGILSIDYEITRTHDGKLAAMSRRNLYRIKK